MVSSSCEDPPLRASVLRLLAYTGICSASSRDAVKLILILHMHLLVTFLLLVVCFRPVRSILGFAHGTWGRIKTP